MTNSSQEDDVHPDGGALHALRRAFTVLAVGSVAAVALAAPAYGSPAPAQHYDLAPVGGEPITNGFVEVIHPNGPQVYAHQVYELNGAKQGRSYQAVISLWISNLTCSGAALVEIPAATIVTNASGNGHADSAFSPEMVTPLGIRGLTISAKVTLYDGGSAAYTTGCQVMHED